MRCTAAVGSRGPAGCVLTHWRWATAGAQAGGLALWGRPPAAAVTLVLPPPSQPVQEHPQNHTGPCLAGSFPLELALFLKNVTWKGTRVTECRLQAVSEPPAHLVFSASDSRCPSPSLSPHTKGRCQVSFSAGGILPLPQPITRGGVTCPTSPTRTRRARAEVT